MSVSKLTPLMQQYWEIKSAHPDKVVLFRMGDFYEMFHEDATIAAPILGIALTSRNKKSVDYTPMCGVPHHSISGPIVKLLASGYKVAICDQIEDPALAKGIVKRAVTRILSPGMVFDPDNLAAEQPHYIAAWDDKSISFFDTSTAEAFTYSVKRADDRKKLIEILNPRELIFKDEQLNDLDPERANFHQTQFRNADREVVREKFKTKLSTLKTSDSILPQDESALRLIEYVLYMQGDELLKNFSGFETRILAQRMILSPRVLRHLEIFETYRGDKKGSLLATLDRTKTAFGARLLRQWMSFPLTDIESIENRLKHIDYWRERSPLMKKVRDLLGLMGDLERRIVKLSNPGANARDLRAVAQSLNSGLEISQAMLAPASPSLIKAKTIVDKIDQQIVDEPPIAIKEGGVIRRGVLPELDELITLSTEGQKALLEFETREKEKTGITSLKVRYNQVFGYYIEITHTHKNKVPAAYLRKQTLVNAERYTTDELQTLEQKILSSKTKRCEMEYSLFESLRLDIVESSAELLRLAHAWAEIDVFSSLAWLAIEWDYVRPELSEGLSLEVQNSRHPVVEQLMSQTFVPNSLSLDLGDCMLLTGPNMAGKSTLMRQIASIVILAQMGSYVPAEKAKLPIFHKIYTRIGASDSLTEGLSTFMVEMTETAEMLRDADNKTLVILDEIGRGTSTYDGMALAQAILEYLVQKTGSLSFFATHYHELTSLESVWPAIQNAHMTIREQKGEIHFLHSLAKGPAHRSYGIQVAQRAGLPPELIRRAQSLLNEKEAKITVNSQMSLLDQPSPQVPPLSESEQAAFSLSEKFREEVLRMRLDHLTPIEALNKISQWQLELS
jgi:DNA mismatch repair protein MutS